MSDCRLCALDPHSHDTAPLRSPHPTRIAVSVLLRGGLRAEHFRIDISANRYAQRAPILPLHALLQPCCRPTCTCSLPGLANINPIVSELPSTAVQFNIVYPLSGGAPSVPHANDTGAGEQMKR